MPKRGSKTAADGCFKNQEPRTKNKDRFTNKQMHNYKKLQIWIDAINLTQEVYEITESIPQHEKWGIISQMTRAAVSIPSNIAEGSARTKKDFVHFLFIALGSLFELNTQIIIAERIGYITDKQSDSLQNKMEPLQKMIFGFMQNLSKDGSEPIVL